jgi:hypothetical protein
MKSAKIENIRQKLLAIKFGILKTSTTPFLQSSRSFIIETSDITEDGHLYCSTSDIMPADLTTGKRFAVKLNFISKEEGLFIKLSGRVVDCKNQLAGHPAAMPERVYYSDEPVCMIKVKIDEVNSYKKRSTSPYTSFLQAINNFTFNKAILDSGL